jgi:hypothetical protein
VAAVEVVAVSIVRVGLAETQGFAEGYDAIFGTKKGAKKPAKARAEKGKGKGKKKKAARKK